MPTKQSLAYQGQNIAQALMAIAEMLQRGREREQYESVIGQSQTPQHDLASVGRFGMGAMGMPGAAQVPDQAFPQTGQESLLRALVNMAPFNRYAQGGLQAQMAKKRLDAPDFQLGPYDTAWKGGQEVARGIGGKQADGEWVNDKDDKGNPRIFSGPAGEQRYWLINTGTGQRKLGDRVIVPGGDGGSGLDRTLESGADLAGMKLLVERKYPGIDIEGLRTGRVPIPQTRKQVFDSILGQTIDTDIMENDPDVEKYLQLVGEDAFRRQGKGNTNAGKPKLF